MGDSAIEDASEETCELYRHFSEDGQLLYVGISLSAVMRLAQHRQGSEWFKKISRVEIEKFMSRRDAENAERKAIAEEKPQFNVRHSKARRAKFKRDLNQEIRELVNPKEIYSHTEAAKILGLRSNELSDLLLRGKIGHVLVDYVFRTPPNERVIEFKGQNLIDFVEMKTVEAAHG